MMTNLLTFASVAKKTTQLLSTVARLRLLLVMLLTLCVSAEVWGAEVTLSSSTITSGKKLAYDSEWTYTANNVSWSGYCYTDANSRQWIQLKKDKGVYVKIVTPSGSKITQLKVTITSATNSSGGVNDITKHNDFSGRVALLTEDVAGSTSMTGVAYTTTVSNDIATLNPSGNNNTLYLKVSGGARIWSMTVTYETAAASCTSITPSLSYAPSSLSVGGTANPTLTGNTGNGTVTYTSSSTSVATVNASTGVVTAKAAGTTTITANIAANNGYCEGTATANVTVTADPYTVTLEAGSGSVTDTELTETSAGAGVTLPPATIDCGDVAWTFAGWAEASVDTETEEAPTTLYEAGDTYTPTSDITLYAVYQRTEEGEGGGSTPTEVSKTYTFSDYEVGTQYAEETYELDDNVTINIKGCHINTQLRVYGAQPGIVISEELPGRIVSMGFNMGNKADALVVSGSSDGTLWTEVGSISTTTNYKDYTLDFGETNYTYFKLNVAGSSQIRIASMSITWESTSGGGSSSTTYYHSTPECSTETLVTLHPNGGTISDVNGDWDLVDGLYKQTTTESNIVLPTITKGNWTFAGWDKDADGVKDYEATETITLNGTDVELSALWECTPLPAPTGINATPNNDGAIIYWNKVTDATGYEVSIDEGNTWNTASAGDNPSYTVTGIECGGTTISYLVRATGDASQGYCEKGTSSESHSFTTTDCDCPNTYSFHYKNNSDWNTDINICFSPVDGATNNYLTDELYLPYSQYYKVGWQGQDQWYSVETEFSSNMPFFHNRNNNGDRKFGANPQQGNLGGGKGRFHVYHDSNDNNKYISFIPTGYTLNFGSGDDWTNDQTLYFSPKTTDWNEKEWYTDLITLTNEQINKQIFVGLQTEVDYVWCAPYSEKLNIAGLRTKTGSGDNWVDGGMTTSYANKTGKFRIYADSGDKNWYVTFVPHYQLKYDANGGTGTMNPMPAEPVSCEDTETNRTFTVAANTFTRDNYNFTGWNTKADGTGQAYAVNNVIVLTGDVILYAQWEQQSCPAYSFHTGGSDVWNTREEDHCFVQKGSTSEWRIDNYIRPNHTHYVVNWQGGKYTNGGSQNATFASRSWNNMPFANVRSATVGQSAYGVKGSLRIYDNSNQENLYISFIPDGYKLKFGSSEYDFALQTNNEYRSELVEYNSTTANNNVSVGVIDANGNYIATNHTQEMRHIFLDVSKTLNSGSWSDANAKFAIYYWDNTTNGWCGFLKLVPGETKLYEGWIPKDVTGFKFVRYNPNQSSPGSWDSDKAWNQTGDLAFQSGKNLFTISEWDAGSWSTYTKKGKFHIYDNSADKNWYVHFYPHYVLTYNANGGNGTMEVQAVPVDAATLTIAANGFTRTGYDFVKWNKDAAGTSTVYNPGDNLTLSADLTIYAQWKAQTYNITYKDQGNVAYSGSNEASLPKTHTYATATTLVNGVKMGYTFGGWYDNPDCTGTPIDQLGATDYTSDITLYAKWTANTNTAYTVKHYQENIDGTYPATPTEIENLTGTTATSVTPAVKDYTGFTAPSTQTVTIAADGSTVVEYKYTCNSYTLTWNLAGGEITNAGTTAGSVKFGAPLTAPTVTKSGLTFIGWSPEVPATMPAAAATYTAIWENCIWIETTTIEDGDEIVFIMVDNTTSTSYAMDNKVTTSSNPLAIEINTDIFSSGNVPNNIIWDIQKDANGIVFYSKTAAESYLRCNAKPNVRVGVGANNTFTLDNGYIQSLSYDDSYLAVATGATTKDWRQYGYSSGNITNQTLKFYKRVCLPEGQYWVKWMVNGQEYTVGNPTTMVTDGQITAIPDNPANDAIGDCADTFMGWSESNLGSAEGQPAPTDLFTTLAEAQELTITENKTFYAVFATAEAGQSSTESIFSEDFSSISKGDNTTTGGSGNSWDKNDNFYSVSNVFQAGGAVRLGKSDEVGYLVTKQLTAAIGETLTISFTVKGWSSVEGNIQVSGNNSEFTQPSAISYTSTMSGSFETKSVSVVLTKANPYIKIATTGKRAFIDDIQITKTTSPAPTYSNYVTNCCALAPATNLTVSGTTANSATLTWTAPTSTTGITKLQVRNAETDAVVVDNIAVNTTTTTINGLTECTSYQYYVVSVGDCEVVSNTVTATPFSGAKTVNYDYNGGTGSPASFTTNCNNQTITLPVATRTGYTFNGWYTAATGGTRVGDANDTYEPATSPVTLYAQWTINQYTVTWNPNGGNWDGNTSNIVQTYEYGATINKPDDPTRENGIFKGWNPSVPSTMPASDKTYTAQWDMVYTLTFVDMNAGGTTTTLTQTSSGQNIVAPTANSEVCDMWTFIGWAPSNSLNGGTDKPADFIAAGETIPGSQITGNKTYYSVYSYNSDNTQEFEIGKSGTYFMYALSGTTKYYATTNRYGSALNAGHETTNDFTTYPKAKVKLTYNSNTNKYKIQITTFGNNPTDGYLYHPDKTENDLTHNSFDNYTEFTLQQGNALGFNIVYAYTVQQLQGSVYVPVEKTGCFGRSSSHFQGSSTITDVYFEPASEIQYYNAANCGEVDTYTMSFHNPFGDENALIWYDAEHEESYYTDKPRNTLIDVFPTMVYNGWAFIGWTANQQYNELIGDENLDDENSATNDPASSLTIYSNTAGWSYQLNSNVTMYPVFTKFEDNEPFDMVNGGDYYIYYIADGDVATSEDEYGATHRIYAGGWGSGGTSNSYGATQSCASATLFTFTKLSNGKWSIYDNTKGRYLCAGTTDNNLALNTTTATYGEWTITVYNGNQVNAVSRDGYTLSAYSQDAVTGTFKNYATSNFNNNSKYYHRVYVGTCTERVYSSNPTNKPAITLSGEPIVTSTADQSIRARGELSISATKLAANGTITLTSDNADVYFSSVKDANFTQATKPVRPLTLEADEKGKLATTTVYVHYKPTSTSNLGVQTANITATTGTNGQPDYATATTTAALRNLPANFVIAAKWGDNWYAMPANMDSQSSTEGWLIEVDDAANPTKAIAAPNTTKYGLKSVYTSNSTDDRFENYGERLVFVENVNEATPVANKTLYNGGDASSSKTNIQVYAQYKTATGGYYSTNPDRYEWIPTTTDLTDYTLTSGAILTGDAVGRTVSLDNHGVFGTLLQDKSYNGMVRLLPVDNFYAPAELQVVEWKQNSVSVMYTGAGTKYTTKVGNNAESSAQTLSAIDHAVYSLSTTDLTTATNQPLIIYIKDDANATIGSIKLTIPAIVATDKSSIALGVAEENAKATSIVVLDGATLTADATKYTYDDITVYPGGNLVIDDGKALGMYSLTLRAGSSWGAEKYENKYPQFLLKGDYSNSSGQINLDYVTTQDYYYPLSVPEEVTIGDIKYPVDIYGSNVEKANKGSFRLKYYDGAQRVAQGSQYGTGWVVVNENTTTTLEPNQGYAIWGIPKKVSVNGATSVRQKYGIHRIPIKKAAGDLATNEKTNAVVQVTAHGINDANVLPNDKGWNYLGNPYLAQLGGMDGEDEDLQMGLLEQEKDANGDWTGGWVYNNEQVRYITVTNDCQNFDPRPVADATIPAFSTFFIQAAQDGAISLIAPANVVPASIAARHYAAQQETAKEITTGIILTGNDQTDRTGLLIADNFTEEYDFNADLSKFENSGINLYTIGKDGKLAFMAINQALAEQPIPLGYGAPADGEYTIAFDEDRYSATDINALYLIDYDRNETTNLLHTDYSFVTAAGTNNERFALQVAFIPQNATSVEWVDDATIQVAVDGNNLLLNNLPTDAGVQVFDALGRVIYATPNAPTEMQITLPTGYYLVRIADKQHAVVINTVIP